MKDETKRQLDEVFGRHAKKLDEQREAKVAQDTKEETFLRAFRERCASTIKPAFERLREYLSSKGMKTYIQESEDRAGSDGRTEAREGVKLLLLVDQESPHYRPALDVPYFGLYADKYKGIVHLERSTITPGRGGQSGGIGEVRLEQLTPDLIEQYVLNLVQEVLK